MSIQEQKFLSNPDNDQSSCITLHLPQYGGTVGGLSSQMSTGPILGDPADVRQGVLTVPPNHPLVRPTGLPIPATTWPHHHHQQTLNPLAETHHRPRTPSWNPKQYPQPSPTPVTRYATPTSMTPIPQSRTPTPTWHPVGNR